jgi:uncharacterized repeat protein (TIGR01451 family)
MSTVRLPGLLAACVVIASGPLAGQQAPPPKALVVEAQNLTAEAAKGAAEMPGALKPLAIRPDDVVRYRLHFTNLAPDSVRQVQLVDAVPAGLQYVAGSALATRGDVRISFSIDGGRTYSTQPWVEAVVDGQTVRRPAPPAMYTHVRWTVTGWVQPGAKLTAEFQAQLPSASDSPSVR